MYAELTKMEYLEIGSSPSDEECAQVGDANYVTRAIEECGRFKKRIREVLGDEPKGAELKVKRFSHDFGGYYEVVCYFDPSVKEAVDYAYKCEGEAPTTWR